ncbi:hypothetical protein SDC9_197396 [bioreactor metagenome]|uniref:Uncharacterized protein n=1 Tax=bioreactor metagenome TaxID=1076179 RepID=A0A645IN66_9ZZZZ
MLIGKDCQRAERGAVCHYFRLGEYTNVTMAAQYRGNKIGSTVERCYVEGFVECKVKTNRSYTGCSTHACVAHSDFAGTGLCVVN